MRERFDVAVIGDGPAGAAAALEAARLGRSVVLVGAREGDADKPCGEGVMPSGLDVLRELGLGGIVEGGRPFPGIRHLVGNARPIAVDLPRPGVAIRRPALSAAFDAALARAQGVERVAGAATAVSSPDGVGLVGRVPAGIVARTAVVADGAGLRVAPLAGGGGESATRPHGGVRFGLRARYAEAEPLDRVEVHMGRGCEVYLTPLPEGEVNVAVLFERAPVGVEGVAALLEHALARYPVAAARLGAETTPPVARALPEARPRRVAEGGAFLAGDAGGLVDPIVGCGVSIALRTGRFAARCADAIVRGGDARAAERAYADFFEGECGPRRELAAFLRRADAHPRLARVAASVLRALPFATRRMARVAAGA